MNGVFSRGVRMGVVASLLALAAVTLPAAAQQPEFQRGEIVLKAVPEALPPGAELIKFLPRSGLSVIKAEPGLELAQVQRLRRMGYQAGPNRLLHAHDLLVVRDGFYLQGLQWNFTRIDAESAWTLTFGGGVIVAVLDTGLRLGGKDTPENLVPGWNCVANTADTTDDNGHGTHVSGTIAQKTNNTLDPYGGGCAGLAFEASIMPVKVLGANGSGSTADIAEGIYWAVDNGAQVINMSLGTSAITSDDFVDPALDYAHGRGVVVVCSSGNDGSLTKVGYPAIHPSTIAVGATDYVNAVTSYSNRGTGLDLVAPGGDTTKDVNGDGYKDGIMQETFSPRPLRWGYFFYQGTSMAAPHVSATVALMASVNSTLSPYEVRTILTGTTLDLGDDGYDATSGYGLVQAGAAVEAALIIDPPEPVHDVAVTAIEAPATATIGTTVTITVTVANLGNVKEAGVDLLVTATGPSGTETIGSINLSSILPGASATVDFTWTTQGLAAGEYTLTAEISPVVGETSLENNSRTHAIALAEAPATPVMSALITSLGTVITGVNYAGRATVEVRDQASAPVAGATVTVQWGGVFSGTRTGITDASGVAVITSATVKKPKSGLNFSATVTSVVKDGCTFDGVQDFMEATIP